MPDRARLVRARTANAIALVVIVMLVGALLATDAARAGHEREALEYRKLWIKERMAVRQCVGRRVADIEGRLAALPKKEVNFAYQARLADVRQRFARVVRGQPAATCPIVNPVPVPTPEPATGVDAPVCAMSEAEAVNARSTAQKLAALQAWVRENLGVTP